MNVVAGEDERDVGSGVGFSGRIDAGDGSGFHEHDPVFPEQNFVPGLEDERALAQRLEVVAGKVDLKLESVKYWFQLWFSRAKSYKKLWFFNKKFSTAIKTGVVAS